MDDPAIRDLLVRVERLKGEKERWRLTAVLSALLFLVTLVVGLSVFLLLGACIFPVRWRHDFEQRELEEVRSQLQTEQARRQALEQQLAGDQAANEQRPVPSTPHAP